MAKTAKKKKPAKKAPAKKKPAKKQLAKKQRAKKQLAAGISNSNIEHCFDIARRAGALAGKVSGAGGGGYVLFLTDPVRRPAVMRALDELRVGAVQPVHFVSEGAEAWSLL